MAYKSSQDLFDPTFLSNRISYHLSLLPLDRPLAGGFEPSKLVSCLRALQLLFPVPRIFFFQVYLSFYLRGFL